MYYYLLNLSKWDYKMVLHLLLSLKKGLMSSFSGGIFFFPTSSAVVLAISSYVSNAFIQLAQSFWLEV